MICSIFFCYLFHVSSKYACYSKRRPVEGQVRPYDSRQLHKPMNGPALFFVTCIIKLLSFTIGLFYCGYENRGIMHEKTQEIFSRIRAGNAEETQI